MSQAELLYFYSGLVAEDERVHFVFGQKIFCLMILHVFHSVEVDAFLAALLNLSCHQIKQLVGLLRVVLHFRPHLCHL